MVARGDLGVEVPYYWIPLLQKAMIHECKRTNTYVIVATQVLQSKEGRERAKARGKHLGRKGQDTKEIKRALKLFAEREN